MELKDKFKTFITNNYGNDIAKAIKEGESFFIDFKRLDAQEQVIADELLNNPNETIELFKLAYDELEFNLVPRFINLPPTSSVKIKNIRTKNLNKLIQIDGIVRQASEVRPASESIIFECPACAQKIHVPQETKRVKEPKRCPNCGRMGKFTVAERVLEDTQRLIIEESPEKMDGGEQPQRINVIVKKDLVDPTIVKKTCPGSKVEITGVLQEVPIYLRTGAKSNTFDLMIQANSIKPIEYEFTDIKISEEDEKEILEFAKDPNINKKFIESVAPNIYGNDEIKESIAIQLFGGARKVRADGTAVRGDIHILLIGDPGVSKTQLLKFVSKIAPKSRYVSGKSSSAAGLTASVVKDEFVRGWSLEAGALVLANKGIALIDELDKMTAEDRSALHEGLESQSYHPITEVLLSDGSTKNIKEIVDELFSKNKNKIIKGVDCEILPINDLELVTTDFNKINFAKPQYVSRHKSPKELIKIEFENGRFIKVTPEHPIWVFENGEFTVKPAITLSGKELVPAPNKLVKKEEIMKLEKPKYKGRKKLKFPEELTIELASLLGFIASEGHSYYNDKINYAEIGVSNTNLKIVNQVKALFENTFKTIVNINKQSAESKKKATKDQYTIRCCSKELYKFFNLNFPELMQKASYKRIPKKIKQGTKKLIISFLKSYFRGDGFIDSTGFGFSTASYDLARDCQDLLLFLRIWNKIRKEVRGDKAYYKVVVSGEESRELFKKLIVSKEDKRYERIEWFCKRSKGRINARDPLPREIVIKVKKLLKDYKLDTGYFTNILKRRQNSHRRVLLKELSRVEQQLKSINKEKKRKFMRKMAGINVKELSKALNVSNSTIYNLEKQQNKEYYKKLKEIINLKIKKSSIQVKQLKKFLLSDTRLIMIKKVDRVKSDCEMVYDITVEPTRTFISEGLVLHNTITISKANIQATLNSQTSVLAAANPKFGRFDPYIPIAEQIDIPPTLLNRFDLIFPMRDLPDHDRDSRIASHMIEAAQAPGKKKSTIDPNFLRKYIAYAKRIQPRITEGAGKTLIDFYVSLRNKKSMAEDEVRAIPVSPRQLEALIRLSEGYARLRLSDKVTKSDAKKAINLLKYCLSKVGMDPETGEIDIDRIVSGITAKQRNNIKVIKEVINDLSSKYGEAIPTAEIIEEAMNQGMDEAKAEEIIQKMKREGEIFEPKHGIIRKLPR